MPYTLRIPAMMLFTLILSLAIVPQSVTVNATPAQVSTIPSE